MRKGRVLLAATLFFLQCNSSGSTPEGVAAKETITAQENEDVHAGMVPITEGLFVYGTTEEEFERMVGTRTVNFPGMKESLRKMFEIPPQTLHLPRFYMDRFEVTNEDFREFVLATGYRPKNLSNYLRHWENATEFPSWAASFPVVWVSQKDAEAYCSWRGKRLPTEEEWEKAARGESGGRFPWGEVSPTGETANFLTDALEPVGNRPGDCSSYGIYDLGGNASELTASTIPGRVRPKPVVRGGCFKAGPSEMVTFRRSSTREPEDRAEHIGFRCVAD